MRLHSKSPPFLLPSKVCLAFHLSAPSITSTFLRKLVLRGKCLPHPLPPTSGRWEGSFRTSRWLSHLKSKLDSKAFFHHPPADGAAALSPCSAESLEASETQTQEETGLGPHTEPQRAPVRGSPAFTPGALRIGPGPGPGREGGAGNRPQRSRRDITAAAAAASGWEAGRGEGAKGHHRFCDATRTLSTPVFLGRSKRARGIRAC